MTTRQLKRLLSYYREELLRHGATAPVRNREKPNLNHLLWMCNEIERFLDEDRSAKAMRWLGFLQGALWWGGFRSIDAMRADNRGETP